MVHLPLAALAPPDDLRPGRRFGPPEDPYEASTVIMIIVLLLLLLMIIIMIIIYNML